MSKLLSHLPALCNMVCRIAVEAGEITLEHFEEGMMIESEAKGDGSPVTIADRNAEAFIAAQLKETIESIPVIGEEACASGVCPDLRNEEYFWLVDPIDGTKEFIKGSPEYTVNIALIKNHVPILGVIYAPALGEMYYAHNEGPAMRWMQDSDASKEIRVRKPSRNGLIVVASRNRGKEQIDEYLKEQKVEKIIHRGSSLKICAVASGKADLYTGFGQTCEWDTAAGQAILTVAGGELVDLSGKPLTYGDKSGHFHNPDFLARSSYLSNT